MDHRSRRGVAGNQGLPWLPMLLMAGMLSQGDCEQSDIDCLRSIKESLRDPLNRLSSWQFNKSVVSNTFMVCSFPGVHCWHENDAKIWSIRLSGMGLRGEFPRGVANCSFLVNLDLSNNHLYGSIPSDVSKLIPYASSLDLSSNTFSGEIPPDIANISYLWVLKLNDNLLTGHIPAELVTVNRLSTFTVANNCLSGPVPKFPRSMFPPEIYANNSGLCGDPLDPCLKNVFIYGFLVGWSLFSALFFGVGLFTPVWKLIINFMKRKDVFSVAMDLGNSRVKTPEAESNTPTQIQPAKALPFSNGVLKRHAPLHLHHHSHHPVVVTYEECLKNHAATLGGHAVDGCGEFMPSPASNPAEPTSLKCAACGCHRNFHRREPEEPPPPNATPTLEYQPHHRHHPLPPPPPRGNSGASPNNSPSPPPISSSYHPSAPHMLLALSHGLAGQPLDSSTPISTAINATSTPLLNSSNRKRFRMKFTQYQKEKMLEFAERVGWKMQKRDEDAINEFCSEVGVDKGVFKVWMHNNKNTFGKKDQPPHLSNNSSAVSTPPPETTANRNGINYNAIGGGAFHHQHEGNSDIKQNVHGQEMSQHPLGTNGSSSS